MKKLVSIFLLALTTCSFCLLMPSTALASSGGGPRALNVQHVQVALHPKPLSATQLATLRAKMNKRASRVASVVPAECIALPNDTNCDGQDPIEAGCVARSYTVAESAFDFNVNGNLMRMGLADLKFSNDCVSNWTKGYSGNEYNLGTNGDWTFTLNELDIVRSDGLDEPYFPEAEYGNAAFTNIVYAPVLKTQACVSFSYVVTYPNVATPSGGNTDLICTDFF